VPGKLHDNHDETVSYMIPLQPGKIQETSTDIVDVYFPKPIMLVSYREREKLLKNHEMNDDIQSEQERQ